MHNYASIFTATLDQTALAQMWQGIAETKLLLVHIGSLKDLIILKK